MSDYKRLTKQAGWHKDIDLKDELGYSYIYQRLAELENKIEQGTLIELPCNVGDTVWTINCWQEYGIKELGERYIVTRYELHENKCSCIEINDKNYYRGEISIRAKERYKGVTPWVFITREEAENKLKELRNGRN